MKKIFFKKYKMNQLQNIKQNYKYIYIYRYHDLTINEVKSIKKKLKNVNYKSLILKQNMMNNLVLNVKGQGSLLIIFGNQYLNLIELNFNKLEFLFLMMGENIYSVLKLKKILINSNLYLNMILIKNFLNLLYFLRKI